MALVTEPIALDRSLNTTEQTPRNLADVLAQALQMLNTTISGLNFINCVVVQALPTTDISTTTIYLVPKNPSQTDNLYDEYINLTGTSAGWEKIGDTEIDLSGYYTSAEVDDLLADKADVGDIPTVNDGTLTIQQNGETKGTFTANQSGNITVNIETPTTDIQTAVDEFETYNGGLLSSLKVTLEPVQSGSGDPSPDNVRPISGHTQVEVGDDGKNLFSPDIFPTMTVNGLTSSRNGDILTVSGATINSGGYYFAQTSKNFRLKSGTYTFSATVTGSWGTGSIKEMRLRRVSDLSTVVNLFDGSVNSRTFTLEEDTDLFFAINSASQVGANVTVNISMTIQVERGSTKTAYVPYNGYQVTVNLGGTYYSGVLDVVTGVFTPDMAEKNVSASDLIDQYLDTTNNQYLANINANAKIPATVHTVGNVKCNELTPKSQNSLFNEVGGAICIMTDGKLRVTFSGITTFADMQTWVTNHPLQVVYELATPQTIQLTLQQVQALVGENHLSAPLDGQEIDEVKYKKMFTFDDVIAYIQSLS